MSQRIIISVICTTAALFIVSTDCGSSPAKYSRHNRHPISYQPSEQLSNPYLEDRPPPHRQFQRYSGESHRESTRGGADSTYEESRPERGQILHRPKSTEKKRHPKSQSPPQPPPQSDMAPAGPIILNRGKGVKYVPIPGSNGYQGGGPQEQNRPSVYVINGGDDEDDNEGIMGSMQTYFKSFRGRIKSAMQGLIGQDGDDRQLS